MNIKEMSRSVILVIPFAMATLIASCGGDEKPANGSSLKYGVYCAKPGSIVEPVSGNFTYFSAKVPTSKGKSDDYVESCFYRTKEAALDDIKATCKVRDRAGDVCLFDKVTYTEYNYTSPSSPVLHPAEPAPEGGGCYQSIDSNYKGVALRILRGRSCLGEGRPGNPGLLT